MAHHNQSPSEMVKKLGWLHKVLAEESDTTEKEMTDFVKQQEIISGRDPEISEEEYFINMGPQHPSTHGVLRLMVSLKGEIVQNIKPHVGYVHRGIEKMTEKMTYKQIIHLTDRLDYLSSTINNHAVCLAVENGLEVEIPERVKYVRTIIDELIRIASHQLWWGVMGMDLGALTAYFYGFRDREKVIDVLEKNTGARLLHSYYTPGGLMRDIHADFQKDIKEYIKYQRNLMNEYDDLLSNNVIFRERTEGLGIMTREEAIAYGVTGPSGRASNFACDVRKQHPYAAYDKADFKQILYTGGDSFHRYKARLDEIKESMNIIEQLVDNIPEGSYTAKMKAVLKLPEGTYFQRVEAARGELGVYVISKGDKVPYRMKFRSPNLSNLGALDKLTRNYKIADLVAIMSSLDLVIPDIDR
jgi:NADH-quinone oxidoreductase subunit D/NADH-quinone oxidoreductase subunit C/D